MLKQDE